MTRKKSKEAENAKVTIVGAGLAGSEAIYQLLRRQMPVRVIEMRPKVMTGAHTTDLFGELVCSNSVGSNLPDRAPGLLKEEMRFLGSYFMETAYKYRVPAGNALAVDRFAFSREMTRYLRNHKLVDFINEEAIEIPENDYVIIATGPLTSPAMLETLQKYLGRRQLEFYDAIAPIIEAETINMDIAFRADRYGDVEGGDYINCPMTKEEYYAFVEELVKAERLELSEMEKKERKKYFSACQPVEIIGQSGKDSLRFGPLKPVGLVDPRTGERPYAVVQLRQDNLLATMYNLVGFQTNLKFPEQERVFKMIPGLENAKFERFGQMHRNSYVKSPGLLDKTLQLKKQPGVYIAGQLCGVEGYTESALTGLVAGMNVCRILQEKEPLVFPKETMIGALINYITYEGHKKFNPMNINFGLFESKGREKSDIKRARIVKEARKALREFLDTHL